MKPRVEWVRNSYLRAEDGAGWYAIENERYIGQVYADGSAWIRVHDGWSLLGKSTQPLAAQALLRAAGVEP